MRLHRIATASAALCLFPVIVAAQRADTAEIVAATLTRTIAGLRSDGDARLDGPFAFDPRIVHAERGQAPAGAPDSVMLVWTSQVRDSAFTRGFADRVVARMGGTAAWGTCGTEPGARPCTATEFPVVAAVSQPWITGDRAQILVYAWYRSSFEEHPDAWFANVVWLHRVGDRWVADRMYNFAGT